MQENKKFIEEIKQKDSEIINILNLQEKETDEINKEINLIKNQNIELNGNWDYWKKNPLSSKPLGNNIIINIKKTKLLIK